MKEHLSSDAGPETEARVRDAFEAASARYAAWGVDADNAVEAALAVPLSLHCWQADDIGGFEVREGVVDDGGIMATGNHPGRARNGDEVREDLERVLALAPGCHRLNLHACYAETGGQAVDRDALEPAHFGRWIEWARGRGLGLDFNPTFFAHPRAADGFTLSHPDPGVRRFWIDHGIACRRIGEHMARALDGPAVVNFWMPDGAKDSPADRWSPRRRMEDALDEIFDPRHGVDPSLCLDAVESKLFGIGSEDYVVGSFEFFCAYAVSRKKTLCLDMGHFHPTETIHDKLSALLPFLDRLLLHLSRPLRWDSDHVVLFNDDLKQVFLEIARGAAWERMALALDFFDASINRVAAYVIGARAARKAMLFALLDPGGRLRGLEEQGRGAEKLALMEEARTMPFGAVWDMLCLRAGVPVGDAWLPGLRAYEETVLARRAGGQPLGE